MRHYYAKQHPRGFANECDIHRFSSRAERDAWVEKHRNDGDVNSASQGAEECTAAEARRILGRKSDALTEQYNDLIAHDIPEDDDEGEVETCPCATCAHQDSASVGSLSACTHCGPDDWSKYQDPADAYPTGTVDDLERYPNDGSPWPGEAEQ